MIFPPLPNTIVDVIWRNRQQDHIYAPLLSKLDQNHIIRRYFI